MKLYAFILINLELIKYKNEFVLNPLETIKIQEGRGTIKGKIDINNDEKDIKRERKTGLEPATSSLGNWCSTK